MKGKGSWNNDVSFADVTLLKADEDAYLKWISGVSQDLHTLMSRVVEDGWKVSVRGDVENECIVVSWTNIEPKHVNANICVTSRSDDWGEAMFLNAYKVFVIWEGQRLPTRGEKRNNWG
jgi:hypothetical protein